MSGIPKSSLACAAAVVLVLLHSGCAQDGKNAGSQGSPKAVFLRMKAAIAEGEVARMVECVHPDDRAIFPVLAALAQRMLPEDQSKKLAPVLEKHSFPKMPEDALGDFMMSAGHDKNAARHWAARTFRAVDPIALCRDPGFRAAMGDVLAKAPLTSKYQAVRDIRIRGDRATATLMYEEEELDPNDGGEVIVQVEEQVYFENEDGTWFVHLFPLEGGDGPSELIQALQTSIQDGDYESFARSVHFEDRRKLAMMVVIGGAFLKARGKLDPKMTAAWDKAIQKWGLNNHEIPIARDLAAAEPSDPGAAFAAAEKKYAEFPVSFITDDAAHFGTAVRSLGKAGAQGVHQLMASLRGSLEGVKVSGARATGSLNGAKVSFEKKDGRWFARLPTVPRFTL